MCYLWYIRNDTTESVLFLQDLQQRQKGASILIKSVILDKNAKPTEEQIREIQEAAKREITFDEDSPELTPAMEKAFRLAAKNRNTQQAIS